MPAATLFERVLAPIFGNVLIDKQAIQQLRQRIDWDVACDRIADPTLVYPDYYSSQNFHGVPGGYLSVDAAVTYDPITQYLLPPGEQWVRQALLNRIQTHPRCILDLGCGTGSTTLMLAQTFPHAEIIGIDLSPYMLVMAEYKAAQKSGYTLQFRHSPAEATPFPDSSFDLITASLLFHETPVTIARSILRECYRLLTVGGELLILDGSQQILTQAPWLMEIFEEPYIRDYASGNIGEWMEDEGFGFVQTEPLWMVNQVTRGVKAQAETHMERPIEGFGNSQVVMA